MVGLTGIAMTALSPTKMALTVLTCLGLLLLPLWHLHQSHGLSGDCNMFDCLFLFSAAALLGLFSPVSVQATPYLAQPHFAPLASSQVPLPAIPKRPQPSGSPAVIPGYVNYLHVPRLSYPCPGACLCFCLLFFSTRYSYLSGPQKTRAAMVTAMDDQIGKVSDALASSGRRDNTIIVFTAGMTLMSPLPTAHCAQLRVLAPVYMSWGPLQTMGRLMVTPSSTCLGTPMARSWGPVASPAPPPGFHGGGGGSNVPLSGWKHWVFEGGTLPLMVAARCLDGAGRLQ